MRKNMMFFVLFSVSVLLLLPGTSQGLVRNVELPEMVERSGSIIHGTVVASECRSIEDGTIFTYTTIRISEDLLGVESGPEVVIRTMGGTIGSLRLEVSDVPTFEIGEEVVLFIDEEPVVRETSLVGWEQGKFTAANGMVEETGQTVDEFKTMIRGMLAGSVPGSR